MKRAAFTFILALLCCTAAQAQRFDSGWRRITADALSDLELSGGDVRVNNLIVAPERDSEARAKPDQLATYVFSLSAVKRAPGPRSVFVQVVGVTAQQTPTVMSIIAVSFSDGDVNRLRTDSHRFPAFPGEVGTTTDFFVRVLVQ